MPFVNNAGVRIHWDAEGEGTPVLLIMGHLYSAAMWFPLLPALTVKHRAIWFDNRGVGESDTTRRASIADFAADALAVLDAAGVEKAHVYGVSMGGGIAAEFAIRYPERVRSLVLGCTAMKIERTALPLIVRLLYRLPASLFRSVLVKRSTPASFGTAVPAEGVERARATLAAQPFTMRGLRVQQNAIADYEVSREAVGGLKMPVLVLHGDQDTAVPLAKGVEFHKAIPGSRMQIFEGAGHNYLVARNAESDAAVLDFFAEVDAAKA